ncbi:MAG: hypothetical protein U0Y82_15390 [Thermoleophilia bacterium]
MSTVVVMSLLRARGRIAALTLGFATFMVLVSASYASVDQNALRSVIRVLPPAVRVLAGAANLGTASGYLGAGYVHPAVLAMLGALVVSMGTAAGRDLDSGAAELVLSRPIAPWRWLAAHTLAMLAGLTIALAGGVAGGFIGIATVHDLGDVPAGHLLITAANMWMLFAALGAVSVLCAVAVPRGARAVGVAAAVIVVAYVINYLAQLWTPVRPLRPLSVFRFFDPGATMSSGSWPAHAAAVLAGWLVVCVVAAHVRVQHRELSG